MNTVHAAQVNNLTELIGVFHGILNTLVPVIVSLAVVLFLWGVMRYVIAGSDKDGKEKGRNFMLWGIIGLVVMVSVWGLVGIVRNTLFEGTPAPGGMNVPRN